MSRSFLYTQQALSSGRWAFSEYEQLRQLYSKTLELLSDCYVSASNMPIETSSWMLRSVNEEAERTLGYRRLLLSRSVIVLESKGSRRTTRRRTVARA